MGLTRCACSMQDLRCAPRGTLGWRLRTSHGSECRAMRRTISDVRPRVRRARRERLTLASWVVLAEESMDGEAAAEKRRRKSAARAGVYVSLFPRTRPNVFLALLRAPFRTL